MVQGSGPRHNAGSWSTHRRHDAPLTLLFGVDPWIVMVIGRWWPSAFLLYWRKVEQMLPDFIGEAYNSALSLTSRMSVICGTLRANS
jgi:hypothetical protein